MTTVTLRWEDPEDASEFLNLRDQLHRHGWLPDPSRDAMLELVQAAKVGRQDGSDEVSG